MDEAELEKALGRWVASLPVSGKVRAKGDTGARRAKGAHEVKIEKGIDPKAAVVRKMVTPWDTQLSQRIRAAAAVDFATKRLREEIREKRGGTYGISVSPTRPCGSRRRTPWSGPSRGSGSTPRCPGAR